MTGNNTPIENSSNEHVTLKVRKPDKTHILMILVSITLVITLVNSVAIFSDGSITGGAVANPSPSPSPSPSPTPTPSPVVDVSIDDDAVLGDKNAKVTIIEFSDYECPFCGRFFTQTYPQIKAEYIDTGKVKLVFRDFPLSFHPNAQPAAEAAECVKDAAGSKGDEAYFEYHDKIFENQQTLNRQNLLSWASEMGYNIESCLNSGKFRNEVQKDFRDGQAAGVRGTPAFFINGKLLSGAQPFSAFQQAIDAEL